MKMDLFSFVIGETAEAVNGEQAPAFRHPCLCVVSMDTGKDCRLITAPSG
jgi:hypothetical protein